MGSTGSITPVNVSQAISAPDLGESAGCFVQIGMPGFFSGGEPL
jgi:hypothetical protein